MVLFTSRMRYELIAFIAQLSYGQFTDSVHSIRKLCLNIKAGHLTQFIILQQLQLLLQWLFVMIVQQIVWICSTMLSAKKYCLLVIISMSTEVLECMTTMEYTPENIVLR